MRIPIVIHHDPGTSFGVTVPDLPGCFSGGDTLEAAILAAEEAVACHVEGLLLDGEPPPATQPLAQHLANPEFAGGLWAVIDADLSRLGDKAERIDISLPRPVLRLIDRYAASNRESRSGFLVRAALALIARQS